MITEQEKEFFLREGYLKVEGVLQGDHLAQIQRAFDHAWETEGNKHVNQHGLLKYQEFIDLIEHPPILDRHRAMFGNQTQLLQYDLLRQGPHSDFPERRWHRDLNFPGDNPVAINTILFIDDIGAATGPTRVIPRSQMGTAIPNPDQRGRALEGEVAVECPAGTAIFINASIWHTGARNASDGLRRGIYLYFGYWWLKRYESTQALPWQALEGASEQRLRLLGVKMPDRDLHMYDPAR
jgi:ectoine hydroxylase-related dioxygenase (phytanoyl-CoA dioxygenase family)